MTTTAHIVIAHHRHIDATQNATPTDRLPVQLRNDLEAGRISYRAALVRQMKCNTAALRRGDRVTIVELMPPMVMVLDAGGREHIVLDGDLDPA